MKKYFFVTVGILGCLMSGYASKESITSKTIGDIAQYDSSSGSAGGSSGASSSESQYPTSIAPAKVSQDLYSKDFYVYSSTNPASNQFVPSGWMGDYTDVRYTDPYTGNCHVTDKCMQFVYDAKKSQGFGWAGVYWQHPINNWGNQPGGYNLMGMARVTFWARGEKGGERIERFMVGGISGMYTDSLKTWLGPVTLSREWTKYSIDLSSRSLAYVSGGFSWFTEARFNPDGCTFYLDEIKYEAVDNTPGYNNSGYK